MRVTLLVASATTMVWPTLACCTGRSITQDPFESAAPCATGLPSSETVTAAPAVSQPQMRGANGARWNTILDAIAFGSFSCWAAVSETNANAAIAAMRCIISVVGRGR